MQNEMLRLADFDPAELVEGVPQGMVRWAPNNAYAQVNGNKPKYAGRICGVSKNIRPVRRYIHSYYTPSQSRSQTSTPPVVVSEMIEIALQEKEQEIEEQLAKQREEINQQHKQQLDAVIAAIIEQFSQRMAVQLEAQVALHQERFRSLEGYRMVTPEPKVTSARAEQDIGSPTQGNNILPFTIS